ncbi:AAA family ATPase [Streptomyces sp. NBC_01341]|uniref:NACHT domain-containing protein n=1 Tax=Streptomyces sp. NBC_01341 TaxID=2903831 RepID=UPI002E121EFE|nr:AAA family ATPase [Streptomyces sp. NBC_01341]
MSLASPEFGRLIVHLFDLCSSPPPLLDVMGNTKTVSGWKNGTHVPRPQTLDAALASMKSKVGYNRWPRRRVDAFDHIARQLQLISRMHQHDGYAVFSRLRTLSRQAWEDASQLIKSGPLFPRGVRLEELYVPRSLEQRILTAALGPASGQLIAGEPGCGKTTLLWSIYRALQGQDGVVPILLKASHLIEALHQETAARSTAVPIEDITTAVRCCQAASQRPVVLIDTLDLLVHSPDGVSVVGRLLRAMKARHTPVILTCRPGEAVLLRFPADGDTTDGDARDAADNLDGYLQAQHTLGWYDEEERRVAIGQHAQVFCPDWKYGPGAAARLEADVLGAVYQDLPLREVCDSPLYLRLLFDIYAPDPPLQEVDVASLFDRVREMRIECDARPGQIDAEGAAQRDLSATARALARYMLAANTIEYLPRDAGDALQRLLPGTVPARIRADLDELRRRGLLSDVAGTGAVRFFHQTFFEYMAADYLRTVGRGGELVERMREKPEDLVLAAVAGQLVPRAAPGTGEELLKPLLDDAHLADRALELYAQMRSPASVEEAARTAMENAPDVSLRRFLRVLPGHRHSAGADRWVADLAAVWSLTRDRHTLRYELFATVRRLAHQHGDHGAAAVEFCDEEDRLSWWLSLGPGKLAGKKDDWLALLRVLLPHDPTRTLGWLVQACGPLLAAGINGVVAEAVDLVRDEVDRITPSERRTKVRQQAVAQFEQLLEDRSGRTRKSLSQVEQAVGRLWSACQHAEDAQQIAALFTRALSEAEGRAARARLFGAGFLATRLSPETAQAVVKQLLALTSPAVQTVALTHVLVPALRGESNNLRDELEYACRTAMAKLPSQPYESDGRRAVPAWLANAITESGIDGDRLLAVLPDDPPLEVWLATEGLAEFVVLAAVAGHLGARAAVRVWATDGLDDEAAASTVRTDLKAHVKEQPDLLDFLLEDAARRGARDLADVVAEAGRAGQVPDEATVERLIAPVLDNARQSKTQRLNLWRALIAYCGLRPPEPDEVGRTLAGLEPGTTDYAVALQLVETAVDHSSWTWSATAPLRTHLVAEIGRFPPRRKGAPSPHRALAVVHGRLAPLDTATRQQTALSTVLDLMLPDDESLQAIDTQEVRELASLLRRVAQVSPEEAAKTLTTASHKLSRSTNSVSNDFTAYVSDVLGSILRALGLTARKSLVLDLVQGDIALACRAVKIYGALVDMTLGQPPVWFRKLGHDLDIAPKVRTEVNSRLRIHARVRCGGPWPELMGEARAAG